MKAAKRVARTRAFLEEEGLDAIVVRDTTDLMWLTGFERVFDTERAHVGVLTPNIAIIHTDSRYSTAMLAATEQEGQWYVNDDAMGCMSFTTELLKELELEKGRICIDASTPLDEYRILTRELPGAELVERSSDIERLRAVKEPEELERMKQAQWVAENAWRAILKTLHPGMAERDISLQLEIAMHERGADEPAFANIVASGPNSAKPHSVPGERRLQYGDLVVFDFGARVNGYCSDTTRTVSIGRPSDAQQRIYDAARAANEEVQKAIRPGVTGKQMHELAISVLESFGFGDKMGHSLGHGVGLDVHELPLASPRYDKELVEGNVVTVEPGVYLPGQFGVRLEDCGVITGGGYVNFCGLNHELQVVE